MDKKILKNLILYTVLFLAALGIATLLISPYIKKLYNESYRLEIASWVNRMGITGILIALGLQILQVIIAFIPGEPIEMLAGALYGTVGGLVICLVGCMAASAFIFFLSKKFGRRLIKRIFGQDKTASWNWLKDSRKISLVTFILFLIPGTPKDMLTYFVGMADISIGRFIVISSVARIPSVVSSTMIGMSVMEGRWLICLFTFLITGLIGILGICLKDRLVAFCRSKSLRNGSREKQ